MRLRPWAAAALTVVLGVLALGCSSSPGSSTRTSASSTTTTASTSTSTSAATSQHVLFGGVTPVEVAYSPDSGPPGTHVQVTGSGFVGDDAASIAQNDAYRFNLLIELSGCELIASPSDATVSVSASGVLSGSFTVPPTGECFQSNGVMKPLSPGVYQVLLGTHTANLGTFQVTS